MKKVESRKPTQMRQVFVDYDKKMIMVMITMVVYFWTVVVEYSFLTFV